MAGYTIGFAPHVPDYLLILCGVVALLILAFSLWRRARGALARALALGIAILALANPLLVRETREGLNDIVALIADRSQSQDIGTRKADMDRALAELRTKLGTLEGVEIREADVQTSPDAGTALFSALESALAETPPDRVAGAIVVTDGQVHDAPEVKSFDLGAPFHTLLTGAPDEADRKLTVVRAARFGIVGENAEITLKVEDAASSSNVTTLTIRVDGETRDSQMIPLGQETTIQLPIGHGGENVVELEVPPGEVEQTLQNNRAAVLITGVRDRLRVLLVSGEPHVGERVWRNLLKADPTVDLVHFTILRPPDKQDGTPINELSLIAFPTRELFMEKLDQFNLVIFDRYQNRDILPYSYFENIARYVEDGGALLLSSGPEFADEMTSVYRTPLSAVLPAEPTGEEIEQAFKPVVTEQGFAHPVTHALPQANGEGTAPQWGSWFRVIGAQRLAGTTVMEGVNHPLLVLNRVGEGRVAQILSDQTWLWARGFEGGGPQAELLRRLAHWLMKEPDLDEERLTARVQDGVLNATRQSMGASVPEIRVTAPSGKETVMSPQKSGPGRFTAQEKVSELGLYRLTDGIFSAVAAAGPLNPREVADMRATPVILQPFAAATGGGVAWIKDGVPDIREVARGSRASGSNWFGLTRRGAYRVTAVEETPVLPPFAALLLILGTAIWAWLREAR